MLKWQPTPLEWFVYALCGLVLYVIGTSVLNTALIVLGFVIFSMSTAWLGGFAAGWITRRLQNK